MDERRIDYYRQVLIGAWRLLWPVVRQILGWTFIVLGLFGFVLPVLQGVLFLVIGIALVGRRNWLIRRSSVAFKRFLRRWAALEQPLLRKLGWLALSAQHKYSRQSRQLHRRYAERRRLRQQLRAPTIGEETHGPRY
jgi:hypothetical protein